MTQESAAKLSNEGPRGLPMAMGQERASIIHCVNGR